MSDVAGRVVQVFAAVGTDGRGRKGAGYLLGDGLVLTARHVIKHATGDCEIRALGRQRLGPGDGAVVGSR